MAKLEPLFEKSNGDEAEFQTQTMVTLVDREKKREEGLSNLVPTSDSVSMLLHAQYGEKANSTVPMRRLLFENPKINPFSGTWTLLLNKNRDNSPGPAEITFKVIISQEKTGLDGRNELQGLVPLSKFGPAQIFNSIKEPFTLSRAIDF